jgi:hypothetical protein
MQKERTASPQNGIQPLCGHQTLHSSGRFLLCRALDTMCLVFGYTISLDSPKFDIPWIGDRQRRICAARVIHSKHLPSADATRFQCSINPFSRFYPGWQSSRTCADESPTICYSSSRCSSRIVEHSPLEIICTVHDPPILPAQDILGSQYAMSVPLFLRFR